MKLQQIMDTPGVPEWFVDDDDDEYYQAWVRAGEIEVTCYLDVFDIEEIDQHLQEHQQPSEDHVIIRTTLTAIVADAIALHSSASGGVSHTALAQIRLALARASELVEEAARREDIDQRHPENQWTPS